jgi:hypothetical protein
LSKLEEKKIKEFENLKETVEKLLKTEHVNNKGKAISITPRGHKRGPSFG